MTEFRLLGAVEVWAAGVTEFRVLGAVEIRAAGVRVNAGRAAEALERYAEVRQRLVDHPVVNVKRPASIEANGAFRY